MAEGYLNPHQAIDAKSGAVPTRTKKNHAEKKAANPPNIRICGPFSTPARTRTKIHLTLKKQGKAKI
jgi:hypothetical protein